MPKQQGLRVLMVGGVDLAGPLRGDGHEVLAVADGPKALSTARAVVLDVVVLDLDLPDTDGFALARGIRAATAGRKPMFIALAGHGGEDSYRRCQEAGIDLHLVKPVRSEVLQRFLGRLKAVVEDIESFDPMI
jgi:CheY-like chemotaxis protein